MGRTLRFWPAPLGLAAALALVYYGTGQNQLVGHAADSAPPAVRASRAANKAQPSAKPAAAQPAYSSVRLDDVPHVRQKPDFCGEACAAMVCQKLGLGLDQDDVYNYSGLDPLLGRGCYTKELARALENIGFQTGDVWYRVEVNQAAAQLESLWRAVHADLRAGHPSILCMRYDEKPRASEHFRLILGYDARSDEVLYHEPAVRNGAYRRLKRTTLLELWPLKYAEDTWTLIRLRLEPSARMQRKVAAVPTATRSFTPADYCQHLMKLRPKIPEQGFTVVIEPPFVVIGDESAQQVRRTAEGTVKWAVEKLKDAYFTKDPSEILDIWLFRGDESYQEHCQSIFQTKPDTPFGYFSHTDKALIMNISTGGGTLVHEIVHPFIATNFPDCPSWFNEGLASLYEQSGEERGEIRGYPNWRLPKLQEAIRAGTVPPFKTLCATTTDQFYHKDKGTNYAQARYLCLYLQERGLLRKFYRRFSDDHRADPTGFESLKAVLGRDDLDEFQKEWQAWVLKLRFR